MPHVPRPPHELDELRRSRRLAELRDAHRYVGVLGLIVALFVFAALAPTTSWALSLIVVVQGITLALALWTGGRRGTVLRAEFLVILVSLIVAAVELAASGDKHVYAWVSLYSAVLTIGTIIVIGRGVARQGSVNSQSVTGAIGVYLLIGMFFVFIYGACYYLGAAPFFAQTEDGTRSLFLYFSYVTLATLGYGDYTPATQIGRTLAVVEALVGQLYLVTVVAVLVSQFGRPRGGSVRERDSV